jgi:hypothetical protein
LYSYLKEFRDCLLKEKEPTSWKIIFKPITGNAVLSAVHVLMCVILSKAGKHVPYGELIDTTGCIRL